MKNPLNVFGYGFYRYKSFYKFKNIPQIFRNIKYSYQRITRGWCDQDLWNMDTYLAELLPSMLQHLADNHYGYPGTPDFSEEVAKSEGYTDGGEKWKSILEEMAYHFSNCIEDSEYNLEQKIADGIFEEMMDCVERTYIDDNNIMQEEYNNKEKHDELSEQWREAVEKSYNFIESEKDKACDMLKKYFFNLWD